MYDLKYIEDEYFSDIFERMLSKRDDKFMYDVWIQNGDVLVLDFSYDHEGGLEGFYVDNYSGTLYINNKAYYFCIKDVFCSETTYSLERDESADLQEGDEDYVNINKEENIMPVANEMNVVTVILMDQDEKLKGKDLNIIGKFEDVVVPAGQDGQVTLLKLALDGKVKELLDAHNKKRMTVVNPQTLERTGKTVYLQPIDIEDVVIKIK